MNSIKVETAIKAAIHLMIILVNLLFFKTIISCHVERKKENCENILAPKKPQLSITNWPLAALIFNVCIGHRKKPTSHSQVEISICVECYWHFPGPFIAHYTCKRVIKSTNLFTSFGPLFFSFQALCRSTRVFHEKLLGVL